MRPVLPESPAVGAVQRPLLCRVDACYQVFFKDLMSYEDYLQRNYESCRELKKLRGK